MTFYNFKCFFFIVLSLLFYQLTSVVDAMNLVEIIDLPKEPNTTFLSIKNPLITTSLDETIASIPKRDKYKFKSVTPREAKLCFYDYLEEKLGKEEASKVAPGFFTEEYFGVSSMFPEKDDLYKPEKSPYWLDDLLNMSAYGAMGSREKWSIRVLLLNPSEAFEGLMRSDCISSSRDYIQKFVPVFKNFESQQLPFEDFRSQKLPPDHIFSIFFSSENFFGSPPDTPEERKIYFLSRSLGFLDREMIQNLYDGAQKIMKLSQKGDSLVIFGNTPYLLGRILQVIVSSSAEEDAHRHIISFPFSGSPNRVRTNSFPNIQDIVTDERLQHLKHRMEQMGLTPKNKTLKGVHFIDVIASGAGIAYVMEEMMRDFKEYKLEVPQLHICAMNPFDIHDRQDVRNSHIAERNAGDGETQMLTFPSKSEPHFRVPATVTYVPNHGFLDLDETNDWRFVPPYNASYWAKEYDTILTAPLPPYKQLLLEYFDIHIQDIRDVKESTFS